MKMKYITKRVMADWKANIWLGVELLIVSVAVWLLTDQLWVRGFKHAEDLGFDITDTYYVDLGMIEPSSPDFDSTRAGEAEITEDAYAVVERLEPEPEIEALGLSQNSYPYNLSNNYNQLRLITEEGDTLYNTGLVRNVTPGFLRVFRYRGENGETPEQLAEIMERNPTAVILTNNWFSKDGKNVDLLPLVGKKQVEHEWGGFKPRDISAVLHRVKYSEDDNAARAMCMIINANTFGGLWFNEMSVRAKEGTPSGFAQRIMDKSLSEFNVGNIYISDVKPYTRMRDNMLRAGRTESRNRLIIISFLLVNVFLGLLGTFWMRTRQRTGELAIMKVSGASSRNVFSVLLTEGLLMLVLITPLAVVGDIILAKGEYNAYGTTGYLEWGRLAATATIVFGVMALSVALGVMIPAWKAMRVRPADAMRTE